MTEEKQYSRCEVCGERVLESDLRVNDYDEKKRLACKDCSRRLLTVFIENGVVK